MALIIARRKAISQPVNSLANSKSSGWQYAYPINILFLLSVKVQTDILFSYINSVLYFICFYSFHKNSIA